MLEIAIVISNALQGLIALMGNVVRFRGTVLLTINAGYMKYVMEANALIVVL